MSATAESPLWYSGGQKMTAHHPYRDVWEGGRQ